MAYAQLGDLHYKSVLNMAADTVWEVDQFIGAADRHSPSAVRTGRHTS